MQRLGETLFLIGVVLLGYSSTGGPWFGWTVVGAVVCLAAGFRVGEFKYRWWPRPPMRDAEHEFFERADDHGDRATER